MVDLPTGTVTFLFTDLEGSTRLWEEHPEAMKDALARHDAILDHAVDTHDGHVVKRTGDGVHAVFATADSGVRAATDAQRALAGEEWGQTGPLRIRMGLHSGAAQLRDGDYFGSVTNRAARLMAVAHGGQVVVSHTTAELAGDALVDMTFLDLGEHRLRDLERPERVLQVCHEDLEREFAPLRSLDAFPSNLPLQTTGFVGREREVADVASALANARVVTLTGVGGVGKTRLATQVAADVLPRYRDGAWLCELASVAEPEVIPEALAAGLGVQPRMGQTLDETVLDFLRSKELLLVLDNCEHLLDSVALLVDRVVHTAARVTVLATSREGLALSGERMIALPSLGLTDDAVTLFAERAAEARADFALTTENETAVAQICARLDGIPLAIELAAARVQAMTPAEIAARLDDQFRLLSSGRRTAVERHQTLRRAIDWSYELLTNVERRVLQRLSVFAGGCTLDAVEAVVTGDDIDALDALDHLAALVRRSLVVADQVGEQTRYRLLETIRQYAQDRLEESGETDIVGRRHAGHYTALAEEAGPHLRAADQLASIARLSPELDNLRTALSWALDHDELDLALPLILAVCVNGIDVGYLALAWAELAAVAPGVDEHPLGPALLAQAAWSAVMGGGGGG
ncbi:MAG: adenylate/guanylate cyclase domain-containing protein, partial [Acidimicrobiia bacterium]